MVTRSFRPLAAAVWMLTGGVLLAADGAPVRPNGPIAEFSLRDYRGKVHRLSDFADTPVLVVAFVGCECPLAQLYSSRLATLSKAYAEQGVAFLAIDSNRQDSITELAAYARRHDLEFPVLKDPGNEVADLFGAVRTPEVFVLDAGREIRYSGRIDDQYGVGTRKPEPTRRDLVEAIDALLAGSSPSVARSEPRGCFIGRVREAEPTGEVTYSQQVSRILQKHCVECHRAGEIAPFPLTSYEDVVGWGETIGEVVAGGRMPPWFASPHYGKFQFDARLSDEEKQLIKDWVADGCPEGDPADLPEPRVFVEGWGLPEEPHEVHYMSEQPLEVPAEGVVSYKYFEIDPGWKKDMWLYGSEARAGNRAVVHHILVFIKHPNKIYPPGLPGELASAYAPGMKPTVAGERMAMFAPAGSKIVFQMHYTPNGTPQQDRSYAGFLFREADEVDMAIHSGMAINLFFRIPAYAENHKVQSLHVFPKDALLLGVNPHMHYRGKSFRYEAFYPDGTSEILMDCPNFDFNWQLGYQYEEPKAIPAGTRLICTAHFDNTENNLNNPDPSRTVRFGEQTWDEMMIGWFYAAERRE